MAGVILERAERLEELAQAAQVRGGRAGRRRDGAYFTDPDVALYVSRRAIHAWLLHRAGVGGAHIDQLLADGADLEALLLDACRDTHVRGEVVTALGEMRVLDPTCGAGAFLLAAWEVIAAVDAALGAGVVRLDQLIGVDIDAGAVDACRASIALVAAGAAGEPRLTVGDAACRDVLPVADVVIGNPPFVRVSCSNADPDLITASVPNVSAWIVERALACARPGARVSFVLPISTACTDAFGPARDIWASRCSSVLSSHFDAIPASLFDSVVQRLTIFEGSVRSSSDSGDTPAQWWTSRYHRWQRAERAGLLERVRQVPLPPQHVNGSLAKIGTAVEAKLLERLFVHPPAGRHFAAASEHADNVLHYKRRWSYFLLFTDFVPGIWSEDGTPREPSELKTITVSAGLDARVLIAVYSSTLFWWYFSVFTDNRNVNRRDLAAFPLPDLDVDTAEHLAQLGRELMQALHACAEVRTCTYRSVGTIHNTYFRQAATRPVLDRIDTELARVYGMSDQQLAFILAFEQRFRGE